MSWYPLLRKRLSKKSSRRKINASIFYKNLINIAHVGATEVKAINWLPTKHRVDQNICVNVIKFNNGIAPSYANEIFHPVDQPRITRTSNFRLNVPFRKSKHRPKMSFLPMENSMHSPAYNLKSVNNINTCKHKIKEKFLENIHRERKMTYMCPHIFSYTQISVLLHHISSSTLQSFLYFYSSITSFPSFPKILHFHFIQATTSEATIMEIRSTLPF